MDDQLLDVNQLAHIMNFTRSTVYRMIRRGDLKAIRIGPYLRVSRKELDRLLSLGPRRKQPPEGAPAPAPARPRSRRRKMRAGGND
jgi:putative molybdopterin biosynthesis protein